MCVRGKALNSALGTMDQALDHINEILLGAYGTEYFCHQHGDLAARASAVVCRAAAVQSHLVLDRRSTASAPLPEDDGDPLLTASQAAELAGPRFTPKFFYENANVLPFTHRGPGRRVSFRRNGLLEWKAGGGR